MNPLAARLDEIETRLGRRRHHWRLSGLLLAAALVALAWTIPVPGTWFEPGAFAGTLMAAAAALLFRRSRPLGLTLVLYWAFVGTLCWWITGRFGMGFLFESALAGLGLSLLLLFASHPRPLLAFADLPWAPLLALQALLSRGSRRN